MLYQRIQCFLEVANCLGFSAAARNLHISQQAVTRQISQLEEELGVRLFYRTTRQVTLTPAGSMLRDDFTQINRQLNDSIIRARQLERSGCGLLRVGFLSSLSRRDVIMPITGYLEEKSAELEIRLLDFVELRNQLLDGRLDLCITTSNDWKLWPGVHTTVLQKKQFQVVYSTRHPLGELKELSLSDLREHTQLILPRDCLLTGVEQWGRKIPCRNTVLCPDISTLMVRLALGEGFSLLTKVIEGHDDPELRYWNVPFPEAHAEIVCIAPEGSSDQIRQLASGLRRENLIRL